MCVRSYAISKEIIKNVNKNVVHVPYAYYASRLTNVTINGSVRFAYPTLKRSQISAEMYSNWTLYIAQIVLRGRFKSAQYYRHFMQLVELLNLCLAFEILEAMLNQIDKGFQLWVEDYEK